MARIFFYLPIETLGEHQKSLETKAENICGRSFDTSSSDAKAHTKKGVVAGLFAPGCDTNIVT